MRPCLDGDLILYEVGFACEAGWEGVDPPPFDFAIESLHNRVGNICAMAGGTEAHSIYLTGKTNFRNFVAKRNPYKVRAGKKPYHYYNLKAYIQGMYDWHLVEGLEADDLLSIEQTKYPDDVIVCSRDKDAKGVPGLLYSWELGNQPSFGPERIGEVGSVALSDKRDKIMGTGGMFFYSQCLTGDKVDTVDGLPKCGPVKAFTILEAATTLEQAYEATLGAYRGCYGDTAEAEMLEQARLLHMSREFKDNHVLLWNHPGSSYKEWMNVNTGTIERES